MKNSRLKMSVPTVPRDWLQKSKIHTQPKYLALPRLPDPNLHSLHELASLFDYTGFSQDTEPPFNNLSNPLRGEDQP